MNYLGEYTGPYWSNGQIQESVEWGDKTPQSQLDFLSRQHDSAYAHYKDARHREAADLIYMREAKKLAGKFPEIAGNLVGYGNYTGRSVGKLVSDVALSTKLTGNPLAGVLKYGVSNIVDSAKRINGTYLNKEISDINKFYLSDPHHMVKPEVQLSTPLEKLKNKQFLGTAGQKSEVIRGRPTRARDDAVSLSPIALPLNASSYPRENETQQPIAVSKPSLFQRLRKKKKKNRVESLESRIERLTLSQKDRFEKHTQKLKDARASPSGFKGQFGNARSELKARKIRVKALNAQIREIEAKLASRKQ